MSSSHLAFIGSGNLAWHLAPALDSVGYGVREVYSPTPGRAKALSQRLYHAEPHTSLDFSSSAARVFFIAVADDAIEAVAQDIKLPEGAVLLHTSGSQPIHILEGSNNLHVGVFYPIQTFTKTRSIDFKGLPILFEGNTEFAEQVMVNMAKAIDAKPKKSTAEEFKKLHIAAVFASNFVNHLLSISHGVLQQRHCDFELLKPLIVETISKGFDIGPHKAQTGPAVRKDIKVITRHLEYLEQDEIVAAIYKNITQHIMDKQAER